LDLLGPESFEIKETRHRALLEFVHQVGCTLKIFCDGSVQRVCSAGNRKIRSLVSSHPPRRSEEF
jgi:hypothetical protein